MKKESITKMNRIYLIKNLSPWMINELLAFSQFIRFRLVIIREPATIYQQDLKTLEKRGVDIFIKPFRKTPNVKRLVQSFLFSIKNLRCFWGLKNFVFGLKAIYWFVMLKEGIIREGDSIHAQFATQASIIALLFKEYFRGVNYNFTVHAHDIFYSNRWLTPLVNNSQTAISISNYNIQYIYQNYKIYDYKRLELSRLGVFIPKHKITQKQKKFTIGFLSWWEEKKGLLILLEAFQKLIQNQKLQITLILAGDGPIRNDVYKFISNNNLEAYIVDHGKLFGKDKEVFYYSIDIFVLPSIPTRFDQDGIPVVLMEAISFGIPIISTNISGIPEICKNNYNGFLIPPGDADALSEAILKFYEMDEELFQQFKRNAYESCKEYDIISNSMKKLKEIEWL